MSNWHIKMPLADSILYYKSHNIAIQYNIQLYIEEQEILTSKYYDRHLRMSAYALPGI